MTPPPATPGADPRNRLLAIAGEHLRRSGKTRVRLVAVAEEAGMTHANVYRYFASREELLDAVAALALKPVERLLADLSGAPDPADDKLERMIFALARGYRDLLDRDREAFMLFADAVRENRAVARRHLGRVRRAFTEAFEDGISEELFAVSDREAGLAFLVDALHRFIHPVSVAQDADRPRSVIDGRLKSVAAVVMRALRGGLV
ncbi:TetR/AcrR family transcriptional regulator [Camelimonas abortus]|uniref:TetR/AcrR family transcriptional regulator n=1 Tax=Camelimonas abortus TaxID=1017184 RepID=A0ABV7LD55_9HYPH